MNIPRYIGELAASPRTLGATTLQVEAVAMNNALNQHGYNIVDQPIYKAFQTAAGLTADGFPGTSTMNALRTALASAGIAMAQVPIYPWKAASGTSGYDGTNAPLYSSWTATASPSAPGSTTTTTTTSSSSGSGVPTWAWVVLGGAAGLAALSLYSDKKSGGHRKARRHAHARERVHYRPRLVK